MQREKKHESRFLVFVNKSGKYEKSDLANDKIIWNNQNEEWITECRKAKEDISKEKAEMYLSLKKKSKEK